MKTVFLFCLLLLVLPFARAETNLSWRMVKGEHFIVHFSGAEAVAQAMAKKAEEHRTAIAIRFGLAKQGDFWLWDDRVKITLFPDRLTFQEKEKAPAWAAGKAEVAKREISSYEGQAEFADTVLPHEIAHLLFREFIGVEKEVPLWLSEGVSQSVEKGKGAQARVRMKALLKAGTLPGLAQLGAVDEQALRGMSSPSDFYAQSVAFVNFLLDTYGAERFHNLASQLKSGKDFEAALRFTYPENVRTMEALERAWKKHLEETP